MRRKERMFAIWTNMASRTFVNVPSYLAMLSNRPFEQVTDVDTLRRDTDRDLVLAAAQAVEYGVADAVLDSRKLPAALV